MAVFAMRIGSGRWRHPPRDEDVPRGRRLMLCSESLP
jgi:hypothetical protein